MLKKYIGMYKNLPLPLKATIWFTICQFLQKGISLLTTPFFTRLLSVGEYGRASTFASWESIFTVFITFSSGHAIMNLCVKHENRDAVLSGNIGFGIFTSMLWGVSMLAFLNPIMSFTNLSFGLIICLFLHCSFQSIIFNWTMRMQYDYKYRPIVIETFIYSAFASFGGLAAVVFVSKTAEAKIIPQVVSAVVIGCVLVIIIFKKERVFFFKEGWKFILSFCVPMLPHHLSGIILQSADKIMIDRYCNSGAVAIYSVAYSVGTLIMMATNAINSAFVPYQFQKIKNKEYVTLRKSTNYIIIFVAFCLCGIMLFGREIILIFGGSKYLESIELVIPICLGVFFNYLFQLFARVQEYYEQKHTIVIASVSCAILNVILNYIFINLFGYKAAAYTTFICYFMFCFLHYLFYRIACKKFIGQQIYDIRSLLAISSALIAIGIVIYWINKLIVLKYILLIIALIMVILNGKQIISFIKDEVLKD